MAGLRYFITLNIGISIDSRKIFDRRYRCTNQWKAHDRLILASSITSYNNKAVLVTGGNDDCVAIWDIGASVSQSNMQLRNTNGK